MAASLIAIIVDADDVWRVFGSKDRALEDHILEHCADDLDQIEPGFAKAPSSRELLALFIAGERPHNAWIEHNWGLINLLFRIYGDELSTGPFDRVNADSIEHVADTLRELGATLNLWEMITQNPPDHIPTWAQYPGARRPSGHCGFFDVAQTKAIFAELSRLDVPEPDEWYDAYACIAELRNWFGQAVQQGKGLSLFYG